MSARLCYTSREMKRWIPLILDTLFSVAWAVWLGGLVLLLTARPPIPVYLQMANRLGGLIELGGIVMVAIQFLLRRRYQRSRPFFIADGVRQLVTFGAFLVAEIGRYSLFPVMESVIASGKINDYSRLQFLQNLLSLAQIVLLLAIAALTAWLHQPRALPASASAPNAPSPVSEGTP